MAPPFLEYGDLLALCLSDDLSRDGQSVGRLEVRPLTGKQNLAECDAVARVAVELLDDDLVSGGDAVLLAARAHDCEHWLFSSLKLVPRQQLPEGRARKRAAYGRVRGVSTAVDILVSIAALWLHCNMRPTEL
jgi:hypothetical protein